MIAYRRLADNLQKRSCHGFSKSRSVDKRRRMVGDSKGSFVPHQGDYREGVFILVNKGASLISKGQLFSIRSAEPLASFWWCSWSSIQAASLKAFEFSGSY